MKLADYNCACTGCLHKKCKARKIIIGLQEAIIQSGHNDVRVVFEIIECLKPERRYKKKDRVKYPKKKK